MMGKCLYFQRAQLATSPCCRKKSFQVCSEETPGQREVIDFSRVRISVFQFGFTRNENTTTVLCVHVHILNLGADFSQIWLGRTVLEIFSCYRFYTSLLAKPLHCQFSSHQAPGNSGQGSISRQHDTDNWFLWVLLLHSDLCILKVRCFCHEAVPYENLIVFSGTYHPGRAFPGRTGQQGLILPDFVYLPVLYHGALGYTPSTVNREKGFLLRYNSSEQLWGVTNRCRHLKLGKVNPILGVRCCSGADISVGHEKQRALPAECLPPS